MPIEIREFVIRASVAADPVPAHAAGGCDAAGPGARSAAGPAGAAPALPPDDALVQACVREVLRVLDSKAER